MLVIAHSTTSTADMFAVGRRETRCSVEFGFLEHFDERQFGFLRSDRVDDLDGRVDHVDTANQRGNGQHFGAFVLHHGEVEAQLVAVAQGDQR